MAREVNRIVSFEGRKETVRMQVDSEDKEAELKFERNMHQLFDACDFEKFVKLVLKKAQENKTRYVDLENLHTFLINNGQGGFIEGINRYLKISEDEFKDIFVECLEVDKETKEEIKNIDFGNMFQ